MNIDRIKDPERPEEEKQHGESSFEPIHDGVVVRSDAENGYKVQQHYQTHSVEAHQRVFRVYTYQKKSYIL